MGTTAKGSGTKTLKEAWTTFDGLPLLFRTNVNPAPEGSRTIIHIHGFAISGRYLLPTASRLATEYASYVPDLPGFGQSHRPPRPLTIDQLGDAVVRFMDQQGIERAVLLGNSLGCPIIASILDEHTDRIEAIVFVSPAGGLYNLPIYRGVAQMALAGLREPPRMFPIALADYARYGLMPSIHLLDSMLHYPTLRRLRALVVPTLVVIGSRDPLVSERVVAQRAIELPHVTAAVIGGAAHAINFSHPDQLANVVRCFLEGRPITADSSAKGSVRVFQTPADSQVSPGVPRGSRSTSRRRGLPVVREDVGTGKPLILLHGLAGSARWWSRNVAALSQSFRVIAIDLPGFGTSPRGHRLELEGVVDQLAGTMDRLGIERASLIGHSLGGLIAGGLAADHPDRVERLILVNAAFLSLHRTSIRSVMGPAATLRWTAPSLLRVLVADGLRAGPRRLTDASIQLLRADWQSKLPRIKAPTLVIWGEHDKLCPLVIGQRIVAAIPGSRLVVVEGAAHNPMWERSEVFDREVLDFLAG